MARDPIYGPSLDTIAPQRIADWAPASIGLLRAIDQRQHALMSGWGGPACCRYVGAYGPQTITIPYRAPPGVEWVAVSALLTGDVTVTLTTAAGGSTKVFASGGTSNLTEQSLWVHANGVPQSGDPADSPPSGALYVAASSWAWSNIDITAVVAAYSGATIQNGLIALSLEPVRFRL